MRLVESSGVDSDVDGSFARRLVDEGTFFWLDLDRVGEARVAEFVEALDLDDESREYVENHEQRSNFSESHVGVRWTVGAARDESRITSVRGIYTKAFLLTVHEHPCPGMAEARHQYERLRASDQGDGPLVLFMVLDSLVGTFEPVLARLDYRLDELEAAVLAGQPTPHYLQEVFEVRQVLTPIMRVLGPYRRDLVGLLGDVDRLPGMQSGTQAYLDAHRSHVSAVVDAAIDCRGETRDAMESYAMATSERQGEVINWLTMVAAVFLPLSFVTGYFGMNFRFVTALHGVWWSVALAGVLPGALALTTILGLRVLLRRQGIRLIPPRPVKGGFASEAQAPHD